MNYIAKLLTTFVFVGVTFKVTSAYQAPETKENVEVEDRDWSDRFDRSDNWRDQENDWRERFGKELEDRDWSDHRDRSDDWRDRGNWRDRFGKEFLSEENREKEDEGNPKFLNPKDIVEDDANPELINDENVDLFNEDNPEVLEGEESVRAVRVPVRKIVRKKFFKVTTNVKCRSLCQTNRMKGGTCIGTELAGLCLKGNSCRCYSYATTKPIPKQK